MNRKRYQNPVGHENRELNPPLLGSLPLVKQRRGGKRKKTIEL
jgi:hypothetical protein